MIPSYTTPFLGRHALMERYQHATHASGGTGPQARADDRPWSEGTFLACALIDHVS